MRCGNVKRERPAPSYGNIGGIGYGLISGERAIVIKDHSAGDPVDCDQRIFEKIEPELGGLLRG